MGDQNAFKHFMELYWNKLYTIAFTFLKSEESAKDVIQEVFLKIWLRRDMLSDVQNPESWLFILTRNEVLNTLKRKNLETRDLLIADLKLAGSEQADTLAKTLELRKAIQQGLELLPAQQKLIFILSKDQGLSHDEICMQLNLARSTVKNSLVKALAFLRNYLSQYTDFLACLLSFWVIK